MPHPRQQTPHQNKAMLSHQIIDSLRKLPPADLPQPEEEEDEDSPDKEFQLGRNPLTQVDLVAGMNESRLQQIKFGARKPPPENEFRTMKDALSIDGPSALTRV
mmetsp:Transcript_3684/g.5555  ORF Transcript_3684/g.5555 Transcript_3684/m.5555 type:complete len:104 (+) Transcript_3684:239-550(+)